MLEWLKVRPKADTDRVFVGVNGTPGPLQYDGLRTMLLRRGDAGRCEGPVNPHAFRHGFAKSYVLAGGDLFTLADLLGHEDFTMTKAFYAIFGFEELRQPHDKYSPAGKLNI
ncbi:MAG: site-specific integrase [Anaerolineae bacterium]|nr:site-specific integrase [Anaerolineae bacterium]